MDIVGDVVVFGVGCSPELMLLLSLLLLLLLLLLLINLILDSTKSRDIDAFIVKYSTILYVLFLSWNLWSKKFCLLISHARVSSFVTASQHYCDHQFRRHALNLLLQLPQIHASSYQIKFLDLFHLDYATCSIATRLCFGNNWT